MSEARGEGVFGAAGLGAIALSQGHANALWELFSTDYLPHRFCYLAKPWLVWTNVSTDVLIAASYGLLFSCLLWVYRRLRGIEGLRRYLWIFLSFGIFILACGATHVMEVVTVWLPAYPLSAAVKVICAAVSVPTAVYFAKMAPALARAIERYLETLETAKVERDSALVVLLSESELAAQDRDRAPGQIAQAFECLNAVLESMSDSVVMIGHDWTLRYGNRKAMASLPEFRVGASYRSCFPEMLGTPAEYQLKNAMEMRSETAYEMYFAPNQQWFKVRVFPTEEGLSLFLSNVTDDKKLEERLEMEQMLRERRVEALSTMAGGLAHEISNPLAIIHGRAFDLRSLAEGDAPLAVEEVRKACDSIVKTAERASGILRGLRGFAREGTHDPMQLASMDEIVEVCVEMQQTRFERNAIEVRIESQPETPMLMCRQTQIGQILTNLLNNGLDAIVQSDAKERWISVSVKWVGDEIRTDVTDSGPGIEDHFKEHLMEPFFTTKELKMGMGVGLNLSRAIAQDHGGTLKLLEAGDHTCFRLVVPLRQEKAKEEESLAEVPN